LVPIPRGILYLACGVPVDIIAYNSRIGNMPATNTIKAALRAFSDQKAIANSIQDVVKLNLDAQPRWESDPQAMSRCTGVKMV
jgi:hypothetical protein